MTDTGSASDSAQTIDLAEVRELLHARGMRWTPQRRALLEVLAETRGHITGSELLERCRQLDPETIPSTVYRTLDVLEELGLVRHAHGADGRQEFHVLPEEEHGHLRCVVCGESWEIDAAEATQILAALEAQRGFAVDLSHLAIAGTCAACRAAGRSVASAAEAGGISAAPA
jgi:Fur family ferric uptake transcriptional regulator